MRMEQLIITGISMLIALFTRDSCIFRPYFAAFHARLSNGHKILACCGRGGGGKTNNHSHPTLRYPFLFLIIKALSHVAIFLATCLATHCETSCTKHLAAGSCDCATKRKVAGSRCRMLNRLLLSTTVSATCLATFLAVAWYVTLCNLSYKLSRNRFARQVAR